MRAPRILGHPGSYYHCIGRVINREFLLNAAERERFRDLLDRVLAFSGLELLTYCALDSHTHLLLRVPPPKKLTEPQIFERLAYLYSDRHIRELKVKLAQCRKLGNHAQAKDILKAYTVRMYSLSEFHKTLNQRCTQSYNARHARTGTLWNDRFKSILVEGRGDLLGRIAAYIDLNPVRAGLVKDPKDYRWCSYAEAVAGKTSARQGLAIVLAGLGQHTDWRRGGAVYRKYLHIIGEEGGVDERGRPLRKGFSYERVKKVLAQGGQLSSADLLRCRVKYFSDGLVIGSKAFVEQTLSKYRMALGLKRRTEASPLANADWGGLCVLRPPRGQAILPTAPV